MRYIELFEQKRPAKCICRLDTYRNSRRSLFGASRVGEVVSRFVVDNIVKTEASRVRFSHSAQGLKIILFYMKVNLISGHLDATSANVFSSAMGTCTALILIAALEA